MIDVGRLARGTQADDAHDVRRRIGERVKAVGDDADRAGGVAQYQLRPGDGQVEEEDAKENAADRVVA